MVRVCIELSVACEDNILDREIDSAEISRCLRRLKIIRLVEVMVWWTSC